MNKILVKGYTTILTILLFVIALMATSTIGESIQIMAPDALLYLLVFPVLLGAETTGFGTDTVTASMLILSNLLLILSFIIAVRAVTVIIRAISNHQKYSKKMNWAFLVSYPLAVSLTFYLHGRMNSEDTATLGLLIFTYILFTLICLPVFVYAQNRIG